LLIVYPLARTIFKHTIESAGRPGQIIDNFHALPGSDPGCAAVLEAHRQRWPGKLDR